MMKAYILRKVLSFLLGQGVKAAPVDAGIEIIIEGEKYLLSVSNLEN